ncbi:protein-tyrosine phosphatase-like protein [Vararia minispora EC-137]|uniref:Protein-tyrosine phosphatase-like protein n=1 Tax=Vararia minispora EC-137 TaxID=1314806 RepID=A0ACB8QRF2_9AGAM|nr:protein-tyrosine phosphatase-like protein [Vararia minispora EC-137]
MEAEPLDPAYVAQTLSNPPFVSIAGVYNVRDIGSLPLFSDTSLVTRPRFAYRSAEVSGIQQIGMEQIKGLGITTVYDLRSEAEMSKYNTPVPTIPGVQILHTPVFSQKDYSPTNMARRFQMYASGKIEAFMKLYSEILDAGGEAFGTILRHVRDKPDEGFLFHSGKDRTGVAAALLLSLTGVDDDIIAQDYSLTRVGREPFREAILKRLEKEPIFASNKDSALNMLSSRHETMVAFMKMLQEDYGGAEGYAKKYCSLTDEDLAVIRANMTVSISNC